MFIILKFIYLIYLLYLMKYFIILIKICFIYFIMFNNNNLLFDYSNFIFLIHIINFNLSFFNEFYQFLTI